MSYLSQITTGNSRPVGQRIIIAGAEKIGKTTLACDAPNSLLIPLEMGYGTIQTPRLNNMLTQWSEVDALCKELIASAQAGNIKPGSTLVWDSATALERLTHTETLRVDDEATKRKHGKGHNMATAHGGYGKAYQVARNFFSEWLGWLDQLSIYGGINNVITCHVFAAKIMDPAAGEYDSFDLLLHSPKDQKSYGARELITQWADCIGFMYEPIIVMNAGEGQKLNRGISQNQGRVLALERTPAFTAGNRYGVHGQVQIPPVNGWNAVAQAIYDASKIDLFNRAVAQTEGK